MFVNRSWTLSSAVLVTVVALLVAARPTSGAGDEVRYVVQPGDTLWEIAASRYAGDPREGVWRLVERNRLRGATIAPGQVLVVPR